MRHNRAGNRLGRNSPLKKATMRDLAKATLTHQRIQTTKAKAKEARKLVDRLITLGKKDDLAAKRKAFSILCDHQMVSNLFTRIAPRFKERAGGYTRIIPLPFNRRGDNASLVFLELTEREIVEVKKPDSSKKVIDATIVEDPKSMGKKGEKPAEPKSHPAEEKHHPAKDQNKGAKGKFVGGIKNIFRKNPSGE